MRDYVDGCSGQLKARRTRKRVHDETQPAVGEDEAPVNAPKWTTAGSKGSLKTSVAKYTNRTITSSPEPSTAAGPSTAAAEPSTGDVFFLNEEILLDENVLDVGEGDEEDEDDSSSDEDDSSDENSEEKKKKSSSSEEEEEEDGDDNKKEKEEDDDSSSSEEEEDDGDKEKTKEDDRNEEVKEDEEVEDDRGTHTKHSIKTLLNE